MQQRRFCLMTVGRAGSTWLINAIAELPHVVVPSKNVTSRDNELIHHLTQPSYEQLAGKKFTRTADLVEYFFNMNQAAAYLGFKSMPRRHRDDPSFLRRSDIQFITLDRRDVPATVASFHAAKKHRTWRRDGGVPEQRLQFEPNDQRELESNLRYILAARLSLLALPNPIALCYEDLCQPGFSSAALDAYFGQQVPLRNPKPPTRCSDYVENHEEFCAMVERLWSRLTQTLPAEQRRQLGDESSP